MPTALVVYESWFGSTRRAAESIAEGLSDTGIRAGTARVDACPPESMRDIDLVVVGAPIRGHKLSRAQSRDSRTMWANDPRRNLTMEADPSSIGMREWLGDVPSGHRLFAAFGIRADYAAFFTGSARRPISRRLRRKGWQEAEPAQSFVVAVAGGITNDELHRAELWGRRLGLALRSALAGRAARVRPE